MQIANDFATRRVEDLAYPCDDAPHRTRMLARMRSIVVAALIAACGRAAPATEAAPAPAIAAPAADAATSYAGRPIAPTMSYLGAGWLDRDDRIERERPDDVVAALHLTPGMVVADIGAGSGYFSVRLARAVGASGVVIATDVQPEMLALVTKRMATTGLANIEPRLVTPDDAGLAPGSIDLALLVDVYHELADPRGVMAGIRRGLRPRGRLVLVEYRGEDPKVAIKPEHRMTLAQIKRELEPLGFAVVAVHEDLVDQRIVELVRDDAPPAR